MLWMALEYMYSGEGITPVIGDEGDIEQTEKTEQNRAEQRNRGQLWAVACIEGTVDRVTHISSKLRSITP